MLGYENVAVLEGGRDAFRASILEAPRATASAVAVDADVRAFREIAGRRIATLANARTAKPATPKPKKVAGGCGV